MLSSGFSNATVSKFLVIYFVASSIGLAVFDAKHLAHIQVNPHLWRYGQISRVLLWQAAGFANSTEALFATILVYHLRVVERIWGSRKFATFILTAFFYTTVLTPILLALIIRPLSFNKLNYLPSGPTATIFAVLAQYHAAVPHTFRYQMSTTNDNKPSLTLPLSDKSTTYLIAAQLALSQFPTTLLPAAIGWAVGTAWRADFLPSSSPSPRRGAGGRGGWRIPAWLVGEKETRRHESGSREDGERYEELRRRLEGESRAAAAAATSSSTASDGTYEQRQRRPLIERFRGVF